MINRRKFVKNFASATAAASLPQLFIVPSFFSKSKSREDGKKEKIWACLIHLSVNMWRDYYYELQLSDSLWTEALEKMVKVGMNTVVIDLGDAIKYNSHPELAVKGAWTTEQLNNELSRIRKMGLTPIPKFNFSTYHDAWLGPYAKMVSSDKYYEVCKDLISEVSYHFNGPEMFHLGMDEEYEPNHMTYDSIVMRKNKQYWGDLYYLFGEVFKNGSRPWVWQDLVRKSPDEFSRMMPRSVIQSNWYNRNDFNPETNVSIKAYQTLESLEYDQIPGGSNYYENTDSNFLNNVKFCTENISDERLLGFMQSSWRFTIDEYRDNILSAIELAGKAKEWYENHTN